MLVSRLHELIDQGVVVTKASVEQEYRTRNEKVKIEYVLIKPAMFDQQVQVTPAEVQNYYNKNKAAYTTPEKRSYAFVVLDSAKLQAGYAPTDSDLQSTYNSNLDRFRTPERVKVRHILLTTDAAKKNDAEVEAKAKDLLKQLQGGADFAELAKKNSQDTVSAAKGGELDWISRGQTVKPFEEAAFSLKPGVLSGLVKTQYGYHILQVEQKEEARVKPFNEVKDTLTAEVKSRKGAEQLQQLADRAAAGLRKDPGHPEKAAADVNGEIVRAENVKTGDPIPQIGNTPDLQNAVRDLKVGSVSAPVSLPGNKVTVALVTGLAAARPSALDEARAQIENTLRQQKITDLVQQRANELASKTKAAGGDLEKVAKDMGLEVKTSNDFNRQGAIEGLGSASSISEAFTAKDGSVIGPVQAADGRAIAKVLSHTAADMSGFSTQETALRDELKGKISRERWAMFEDGLRQRLETKGTIKVRKDALDRLTNAYKG
jgi:peptidyl-prolyl cis-trans isomerase D